MQHEILNPHKIFRDNIMYISVDNELNTTQTLAEYIRSENKNADDYEVIIYLTDYCSRVFETANKDLKETILEILIVDNYKYLYKTLWDSDLEIEDIEHLMLYNDNLNIIKEKMKNESFFFCSVLRNVIDLYYMTSEEEYFFIQEGIKKTKMEEKLLKIDKTYVFDRIQYSNIPQYDLNSLFQRAKEKLPVLENELAYLNMAKNIIAEQIHTSLSLVEKYNEELFTQNMEEIVMYYYNQKKEEIKKNGISSVSKNDLLIIYQIENTSLKKAIDSFYSNKDQFLDMIYCYFLKDHEAIKIKQKNPNQ